MTDRIAVLLDRYADALVAGVEPAETRSAPVAFPRARRRLLAIALPTAAAVAVVVVALLALAVPWRSDPPRTVFASDGPELGTAALPEQAREMRLGSTRTATAEGPADLLATAFNAKGTAALLASHARDGSTCFVALYLPPVFSYGSSGSCAEPGENPWGDRPLTLGGMGPAGAPGGIKDPALVYGQAPPGTRRVVVSGPQGKVAQGPAFDGGPRYGHRAFFILTWDYRDTTAVRAFGEDGHEMTRLTLPYRPPTAADTQSQCAGIRMALRSHFQRAIMVGSKWAAGHPGSRKSDRLSPRVADASQDAGAQTLLDLALRDVRIMGGEERYEYRLAANVITGERQCFVDERLRQRAVEYLGASG